MTWEEFQELSPLQQDKFWEEKMKNINYKFYRDRFDWCQLEMKKIVEGFNVIRNDAKSNLTRLVRIDQIYTIMRAQYNCNYGVSLTDLYLFNYQMEKEKGDGS
jgi:hypothetical protein